jgi:hypothetical protein
VELGTHTDGRSLDYDEASKQFSLAGSPVTPEQVLNCDGSGQIVWASDDLRNRAYQLAQNPDADVTTDAPKDSPQDANAGDEPPKKQMSLLEKIETEAETVIIEERCANPPSR